MRNTLTRRAAPALALAVPLLAASHVHAQETTPAPADMATTAATAAAETHAAETQHVRQGRWNDTFVGARYADDFYFPGSAKKVAQKIGFLTTVGGFKYGSYAFNVDYLVSDKNNPEAGGTHGSQEVYSVGRVDWSAGKILGRSFANGIVRDAGITTGFDFSSKNDAFASRARMLIVGPSVDFAVPRGYWNAMVGWRTETNYNGIVHKDVKYDTAAHVETSWLIPVPVGPASTVFKGFLSATGNKGVDGFHHEAKPEVLTRMALLFDIGALAGHPRAIYAGPGYEYWHNMFGVTAEQNAGTRRSAATLVAEFHF